MPLVNLKMEHPCSEIGEYEKISKAAAYIVSVMSKHGQVPENLEVGIVCGSGLSRLATCMTEIITVSYLEVPNFPHASVEGHHSKMVIGKLNEVGTICLQGRFHFYEGHEIAATVFPIRVMSMLGVKTVLITNSAGGLNQEFLVGDIMVIEDHISLLGLSGISPLRGPNLVALGPRFPSLSNVYHPKSYDLILEAARDANISSSCIRRGTYVNVGGPAYETPAEVRFLRAIGGDAVGMSTVPEVIAAAHCGMRVLAFSLITNICVMDRTSQPPPSHHEVLLATQTRMNELEALVFHLCGKLSNLHVDVI